ncbi:hypothetical protein BATDEDRAFT_26127 [Batrachochytrium dendrobatidis JAM81]|uniref:Clathrin/coatomer adaptor adaptin-like N-terminal domain-containing protein n=1 Tax=Batrachochytrium dendrobatidis (strain JAM81 / FGSC 10211) TaxID=684364 RepID=F4P6J3_BATDJ|nr:uncharacterized protein BATDEDRAFT_26127 [Batrachochytrium dendrobatidis JAM81]EGF78806.1 hypothetical protein BATDEDRAFT_26127 [Batrachochytrium dendrobatidis JAM81]|eukprot:XP_006680312.1 hypothetical protein BATDEDRAFT_26127 [Batrachochytrium dendrobatidis JAM81]
MQSNDIMKELIKHLEDLKLLTTDAQLHKADEIWYKLLDLIMELKQQDYMQHLQSIELQDIITKYLEYNRPSLQIKVMEFTTVFLGILYSDYRFKAMKACTELFGYGRWSEECKLDIKPMVEIIVHESDQEMLELAIGLFLKVYHNIDDENFGIVLSILVSRLESSSGSVAVGFIKNLKTMYRNIHRDNPVKAAECGIIPAIVNTLRSVDQEVIYESIDTIDSFCNYAGCEVISAELIRLDLIQTLNDLCIRYSDNFALKPRMIWIAGTVASNMRDFPVSLARSLVLSN